MHDTVGFAGDRREVRVERRCYFLVGDVLSNASMGMASAWIATVVAGPDWHMLAAMLAGMGAAMALSLALMPLYVGLFGAMEVMLPVMLTAMVAGMLYGMLDAMFTLPLYGVLGGGMVTGILVLLLTYATDTAMHAAKAP